MMNMHIIKKTRKLYSLPGELKAVVVNKKLHKNIGLIGELI